VPLAGSGLAGIALAAGAGTRLRPLTDLRPKALCPVGGRPLVDHALDRLAAVAGDGVERLAVNAHHHADLLRRHCESRATVSVELPVALGTAGGVAGLRGWLDGRDALVTNADAYLPGERCLAPLADGWDGARMRLLCVPLPAAARPDFTAPDGRGVRYVGACLLPWSAVRGLRAAATGLYEVLWRDAAARGELDLVVAGDLVALDCGTPADYLAANLHASGGASVVGEGAVVRGRIERCVVWDGAYVGPDENLRDTIRAGTRDHPLTVAAG
jgi:GTP:adenosylcobinamide-phosphate guanylyltransferase